MSLTIFFLSPDYHTRNVRKAREGVFQYLVLQEQVAIDWFL